MKNIVITGASRGIGYETAKYCSQLGHTVFAIARSADKLSKLDKESSGNIITIKADLTTAEGLTRVSNSLQHISRVDVLINNAGTLINKPFLETTNEEWQHHIDVNLLSVVKLIKTLYAKFEAGSHIVNIGSMGGFQGSVKFPGLSAYSTSKGALAILTEALSTEFAGAGIAVNCLCLGAVQTEMLNDAFPGYSAPVQPDEMAKFISEFGLNSHKYMNGKILPVALNNPE